MGAATSPGSPAPPEAEPQEGSLGTHTSGSAPPSGSHPPSSLHPTSCIHGLVHTPDNQKRVPAGRVELRALDTDGFRESMVPSQSSKGKKDAYAHPWG